MQQVDYVYDYLDRRTMRVNPLDTTTNYAQDRFAYDGWDILLEQVANNTGGFSYTTYANLWVPDGENSLYLAQEYVAGSYLDPSLIRWAFSDAQQSTSDIVVANNSAGTSFVRWNHLSYDSAGNIVATFSANNGWGTTDVYTRYTWQGLEIDIVTGLIYARARYLDTRLSQFLNNDPITFSAGQWNLRVLSGNDPVNYTDRSGLREVIENSKGEVVAERNANGKIRLYPNAHKKDDVFPSSSTPDPLPFFPRPNEIYKRAAPADAHNFAVQDRYSTSVDLDTEEIVKNCKPAKPAILSNTTYDEYLKQYEAAKYRAAQKGGIAINKNDLGYMDLVGTDGAGPCIGLIVETNEKEPRILAFHFDPITNVEGLINPANMPPGSTGVVFGGEDSVPSKSVFRK